MHVVTVAAESDNCANDALNPIRLGATSPTSLRHRIARHGADCPPALRRMGQEDCLVSFLIRRRLTNNAPPPRAMAERGNSAGQATSGVTMGGPKAMVWVPVVAPFLWSPAYEAVTMSFPVVVVGKVTVQWA